MTDTSFVNIAAHLPAMARRQPETSAIMVPSRRGFHQLTYHQLNQECDRLAHGLETVGIGRGVRAVLMIPPSPEFFALTFALFKIGAISVMIDPGMGLKNLRQCLAEAGPEAF